MYSFYIIDRLCIMSKEECLVKSYRNNGSIINNMIFIIIFNQLFENGMAYGLMDKQNAMTKGKYALHNRDIT